MGRRAPRGVIILSLFGVAATLVGTWLPWQVMLARPEETLIVYPGLEIGIRGPEGPDFLLLGLATLGVCSSLLFAQFRRPKVGGGLLGLTGVLVMAIPLQRIQALTLPSDLYFFGPGLYVTLGGGAILFIAGGLMSIRGDTHVESASDLGGRAGSDSRRLLPPTSVTILLSGAVLGMVAGAILDWIVPKPTTSVMRLVVQDARPVLTALDGILLSLVIGGGLGAVVLTTRYRRQAVAGWLLVCVGLATVISPLWQYVQGTGLDMLYSGIPTHMHYLLGPGAYATVVSGTLLIVAGAFLVSDDEDAVEAEIRQNTKSELESHSLVGAHPFGAIGLAVGGALLIGIGSQLAWLHPLPGATFDAASAGPAMQQGIVGSNAVLLGIVLGGTATALGALTLSQRYDLARFSLLATGTFAIIQASWRLLTTTGLDGLTDNGLFVAPGVFVTIVGGVLLVIAGAIPPFYSDDSSTRETVRDWVSMRANN